LAETKRFPLRVVLTVTTGRLLTEPRGPRDNGIDDLYEILSWMCNESVYTHQLGRFGDECQPWLFRWFPELVACSDAKAKESLDRWVECDRTEDKQEGVRMWLAELRMIVPGLEDEYDVPRIPADDHDRRDPHDELVVMLGTDEGIITVET
jgi:hypothetical protein